MTLDILCIVLVQNRYNPQERKLMLFKRVTEPLSDPSNTLEMLLEELEYQATETARWENYGPNPEDATAALDRKVTAVIESFKARKLIRAEILHRFKESREELLEHLPGDVNTL